MCDSPKPAPTVSEFFLINLNHHNPSHLRLPPSISVSSQITHEISIKLIPLIHVMPSLRPLVSNTARLFP